MKHLIVFALFVTAVAAFGQGTILFNNRVTGQVDAPVLMPDGTTGFGSVAGAQAQLFLVSGGNTYTALTPATTFRTTSAATMPYVVQPATPVIVPGIPAGQQATVVLRAWAGGATYDSAVNVLFAQSFPITITLGGTPAVGAPIPDAFLTGLQGFVIGLVPEPTFITLCLLGTGALLLRRRR